MANDETLDSPLPRREILKAGALGVAALGLASLAPFAQAAQGASQTGMQGGTRDGDKGMAPGDDPRTKARDAREWQRNLRALGTLSLTSAEAGIAKATNPAAKVFANFEATEQRAVSRILDEQGVPKVPLSAADRAVVRQHEATTGAEFDRVFAGAQLETHQKLLALNEAMVRNSEGKRDATTREARHLSILALPAILEHIAHSQQLLAILGGAGSDPLLGGL